MNKRINDTTDPLFGLIKGVDYKFDEFGFVDWRALIPTEHLFPNKAKLQKIGKEVPKSIEGLDDSLILVRLGGVKWLARMRGYTKVEFEVLSPAPNTTVRCTIHWLPNYENPQGAVYQEIASCNDKNADEFYMQFSETIAANRAFVRCVRNFLNIHIVGEEEIFEEIGGSGPKNSESSSESGDSNEDVVEATISPQSIFLKLAKKKGLSFKEILEFCEKADPSLKKLFEDNGVKSSVTFTRFVPPNAAKKLIAEMKKGV